MPGYENRGYERVAEPSREMRGWLWSTAVGLQAVDGLQPSQFLIDLALENIEGQLTLQECSERVERRYAYRARLDAKEMRIEEADRLSVRIACLLAESVVSLTPAALVDIHTRLYRGLAEDAGAWRTENVTRPEQMPEGVIVLHADAAVVPGAVADLLAAEREFSYAGMEADAALTHLASLAAALWQTYPFRQGNTQTIAVFLLQYLRALGYREMTDACAEHAMYYRGALVCACHSDLPQGIAATSDALVQFLRVLVGAADADTLDEADLTLEARRQAQAAMTHRVARDTAKGMPAGFMTTAPAHKASTTTRGATGTTATKRAKVNTANIHKVEIHKVDIERDAPAGPILPQGGLSAKTMRHVETLREAFGYDGIWGRGDVMTILGTRGSGASKMIGNLLDAGIIEPVAGYGKGRYHFVQ